MKDGRPDLWINVGRFAKIVNRSRRTIYFWIENGTLKDFGYSAYQDTFGRWFIRVTNADARALKNVKDAQRAQSA